MQKDAKMRKCKKQKSTKITKAKLSKNTVKKRVHQLKHTKPPQRGQLVIHKEQKTQKCKKIKKYEKSKKIIKNHLRASY